MIEEKIKENKSNNPEKKERKNKRNYKRKMASSVSSNGGSNNVMIRSKADSIGVAGGGQTTAMDERNTQTVVGSSKATTAMMATLAAGPERGAATADDSAISFSEEEEEEEEEDDDEEGEMDDEDDDHPESSSATAAFNAAAAAAAFQRQLLANFPLFHHATDGSSKLDSDPSNPSAAMEATASASENNSLNPFESYMAAAAAAAAAANAEALFRHQRQLHNSSARLSEKRTAHDSGTDDNDVSIGGKGVDGSGSGQSAAGIHQQLPSNKRRKQSKPVRISSDETQGPNDDNAAMTAFLAAQTAAAAAALFHQNNRNASSEEDDEEEEEEGALLRPNSRAASSAKRINGQYQQDMMDWARSAHSMVAGSNEGEQEEGQIIRNSSGFALAPMFDQQLANRLLVAGNSSSAARNFAEFLASSGGGGANGKGFAIPPAAYGANWNQQQQQQQMMMNIMSSMNRNGLMGVLDDGELSRSSSHCSGSPTGGLAAGGNHSTCDAKRNDENGERSSSDSPFAFRNMFKYGSTSGGFFPSAGGPPSISSAHNPFLFPFLSSSSAGNSPLANQSMGRGGLVGSPGGMGGSIRIFNPDAYCELCNKEFCNKYFLKTHKANKHGIFVDNVPTTSGGGGTPSVTPDGRISCPTSISTPSSAAGIVHQSLPFSVSSTFGPPSLSLTVGAMTYPMHPPSAESAAIDPAAVSYSPVATTSPSKSSIYPSVGMSTMAAATLSTTATTTIPSLAPMTTPTSATSGAGLMDFFPMWPSQTTTPPVSTVNNTMASMMPSSSTAKQQPPHLAGIVNPEAYCELCQKEFCNKYFLKRHKAKMHGIVPPDGPTAPSGNSAPSSGGGGSSSHKRSRSHSSKAAPSAAVDLVKMPPTAAVGPVTSPATSLNLSTAASEAIAEHHHPSSVPADAQESTATTPTTPFNLLVQGGANESAGVPPAKLDLNTSGGHSLSLLKIPTPSLSAMFSSPPMDSPHPTRLTHSKTPCSSSSSSAGGAAHQSAPQQLFSPERLRQMGVINTEAFCEICCKEFCNKYFLRTHKFKKHGIGSMPEQPQQQPSQPQCNPSASESSSSTGMVRQHHYNNNNNNINNNKRGGQSPTGSAKAASATEINAEQKMPLNLVSTPPVAATTTTTTTNGNQANQNAATDGGMPLSCDLCQRPFQSAYLLHMHRTYFHNQPPPADESIHENDASATGMDEETPSDNEQEEHFNTPSPRPASVVVKSEPEGRNADEDGPVSTGGEANNASGGITISADLQKLQSMIMELNGSPSAAAAAANEGDRRRCWMDGPVKSASGNPIQPSSGGNNEPSNPYISGSGGGIVKIVNPASSDPSDLANLASSSSSSSICHLCGNKDFLTPSFLQIHMQNYHGINATGVDPSAAAMEAAVAAAASQLGLDRLLDFGAPAAPSSASGHHHHHHHHGGKRSGGGRSSSSASAAATRSYCQICNKELCNKYFMKTHMLKMHGIHLEASGGGSQIGGVQCDICHKELCSKYFLKVHKQNTHGIVFPDHEMMLPNGLSGAMLKEQQHPAVMDLSFHQQQQQQQQHVADGSNSPAKTSTECCPLCPKRFKSTKALKAHLSHDHSGSSGTSSAAAAACCYICNQQFADVVALQVHLIKNHASHLMDHHQTPPPPQVAPASVAAAASGNSEQTSHQGCLVSSPSPKSTSPSSLQRSNYCDFSAGSLPGYLFSNERPHGGQADACPPMPGLVPASSTAHSRPSSAVGGRRSPQTANQQKIQCPLCGHQLPLEQFQTHLMAHQFPLNFLHTLMPPSSSAGPASQADEEHDDVAVVNQQQRHAKRRATGRRRRRYRCSVCSRKFATRQLCLTHILQRHPPSMRSHNSSTSKGFLLSSPTTSPVSCQTVQSQQRPLTCPRCGYATRQPQLLRLHLRTQQCIPVVARNPDLQQLPPYLAVPTSTASNAVGHPSRLAAIVNNKQGLGLQTVRGQHAHRQDFVLQAFLLTQPDADKSAKSRRSGEGNHEPANGHYDPDEQVSDPLANSSKSNGNRLSRETADGKRPSDEQQDGPATANNQGDNGQEDEQEEGQNQSCNFIPSLILLPVNRRIANPLSLTFSLTPA